MFTKFIFYKNSLVIILKLTILVYKHFWRMCYVISRKTSGLLHFLNLVSSINCLFVLTSINTFLSNKPAGCWTASQATVYTTYKKTLLRTIKWIKRVKRKVCCILPLVTAVTYLVKPVRKVLSFVFPVPRPYLHMFRYTCSSQYINVKELLLAKMLYNVQLHCNYKKGPYVV
jgi:hypothetical protein